MAPRLAAHSQSSFEPAPSSFIPLTSAQQSARRVKLPPSPIISEIDADDSPMPSPGHYDAETDLTTAGTPPSIQQPFELPFRPQRDPPTTPNAHPHTPGELSAMPQMQRAYSSPGLDSSGRFITPVQPGHFAPRRPSSPLSSGRRRSPLRSTFDESYPSSWSGLSIEPNIPEHAELKLSSSAIPEETFRSMASIPAYSNTFPRSRRRPASPLHQSASAPSLYARSASPHLSGTISPAFSASKYANETYPTYSFGSTSSMPSTPTSLRSRSPSISSLETIEDIPDAEEAARLEAEEIKLRSEDTDLSMDTRRRSLDLRAGGLRSNEKRKRWSVCGAERRADFSLEPIEE